MKKLLYILIFFFPILAFAGQNTLDTDVFGGVAGTALHTYNANWVNSTVSSTCADAKINTPNGSEIGSNEACDIRTVAGLGNDQFVQATIGVMPTSSLFLGVRMGGSAGTLNSGWCVGPDPNVSGNAYRLFKCNALNTTVKVSATVASANDVLNVQIVGNTITVMVNGVVLSDLTTTDSSFPSGSPGLVHQDAIGSWKTWSAGSVTSGTVQGARLWAKTVRYWIRKARVWIP